MAEIKKDLAAQLEAQLPRLMRILYRPVSNDPFYELPIAQLRIMRLLYTSNRTVTSLGEELDLTPSAVTQMANRLQEAGLVERAEDATDRRVKHLALTTVGRERMRARQERRIAMVRSVLERLPQNRQLDIIEAIEELISAGGDFPKTDTLTFVAEMEQAVPPIPPYEK